MEKVFGIDVSKWQGKFDFAKAKNEGVKFVILRASYSNSTSKGKDNMFETYYKNAKNNKIPVGAYHYSTATIYEKGKAEAEYMYNNCLKGKQFEYPIYIDVEDKIQSKAGKKATTEAIKGFCEYMEKKGYYVGIYANSNFFKNYIDLKQVEKYDRWIASWTKTKPTTPSVGMWQFGGDTNLIRSNKIANVVCDQNYAYKDYPTIIKQKGVNGYKKEINKTEVKVETITKPVVPSNSSLNAPTSNENSKYYKRYVGSTNSIVEALISLKIDYSFSHRSKIAKKNGIKFYIGLASQNTKMLDLLKRGLLLKP